MLSRAASTARAACSLLRERLQRARRSDTVRYHSSRSCSSAAAASPAEPRKRRAIDALQAASAAAAPLPQLADSADSASAPSTATAASSLDEHFMRLALGQARQAASRGEVPVGALLVSRCGTSVLAAAGNGVEGKGDATAHAELLCLQRAAAEAVAEAEESSRAGTGGALSSSPSLLLSCASSATTATTTLWPRSATAGSTLYVTLEPCAMCAGAALLARVGRIVYGARNAGAGADGSWVSLLPREREEGEGDGEGERGEEEQGQASSSSSSLSYPSLTPLPSRPHHSHPALEVTRGVLASECGGLLKDFFRKRRTEGTRGSGRSGGGGSSGGGSGGRRERGGGV